MSFEINIQKKAPPKKAEPPKVHKAFAQDDDEEDSRPKTKSNLKGAMPFLINEISKANEEKVHRAHVYSSSLDASRSKPLLDGRSYYL